MNLKNQYKFYKSLENESDNFEITPLIDVLFILLIFFILTSGISYVSTSINITKVDQYNTKSLNNFYKSLLIEIQANPLKYILDSEQFDNIYDLINYLKIKHNIDNNTSIKLAFDSSIDIQTVINLLSKLNRLKIKSIEIFSEIY